jgi:hypothetical protein
VEPSRATFGVASAFDESRRQRYETMSHHMDQNFQGMDDVINGVNHSPRSLLAGEQPW